MFTRTLISLTASVLITGASMYALVNSGTHVTRAPASEPAVIDGLPVTDLPGMTVRPPAQKSVVKNRRGKVGKAVADLGGDSSLLHELTVQVASPHVRMPYYSFASAALHITKD